MQPRALSIALGLAISATALSGWTDRARQRSTEVPFDLDATRSTYPFVTRLQGRFIEFPESLVIIVDSGIVRSQIPPDLGADGTARDVSVAFGLGYQLEDGWAWSNETDHQPVAPLLHAGETKPVPPMRFLITGIDTVALRDRWLAVQLSVQQRLPGVEAGRLNSYACAEDNLHGPTPASRQRASGMKAQYSTIC